MIDTVNRKKITDLLIAYMAGQIQWSDFYHKGYKYAGRKDPALTEIYSKVMADSNPMCDHYINIIKLDWHYYVQMVTFLQSDKNVKTFHYYNPYSSKAETFSIICFGIILPLALYAWLCTLLPSMLYLFFLPILAMIILSKSILDFFGHKNHYFPDTELPFFWPYDSEEEFKNDYLEYAEKLNIPLAPPNLEGKVSKVSSDNYRWVSPRPDE